MSAHSENVKKMVIWMLEAFGGPHARTIPIEVIDAMVERSESSADFLLEIRDRLPEGGAATEATLQAVRDHGIDMNSWLESLFNAQRQVELLTEIEISNGLLHDIKDNLGTVSLSRHRLISAATTNATVVKDSAGQLYTLHGHNSAASDYYLKLYQKSTVPVVGTDTPVETYVLKAGQPFRVDFTHGNPFTPGIAYALTANLPDNDNTAIGAGEVVLVLHYK